MTKSDEVNLLKREFSEWGLNEESPEREAAEDENSLSKITNEMTEVNLELLDRIEEIEMSSRQKEIAPAVSDIPADGDALSDINNDFRGDVDAAPELDWKYTDTVSDRSHRESRIMDVIMTFEKDIDATTTLEGTLQADIRKTLETVSSESKVRTDLEARAGILESQVALVGDLRKEIPAAEEDRNRISNSLSKAQTELKSVTDERNALSETLPAAEECDRKIKKETLDLKEQASTLSNKVEDTDQLRRELTSTKNERDLLDERAHEFERRLETTNSSIEAVKSELDTSRNLAHKLRAKVEGDRAQIADLKRQSSVVNAERSHVRMQIDRQVKTNRKLETQVKKLTRNCEVVDTKLNSARRLLNRFNVAAIRFHQQTRNVLARPHSQLK